MCEKGVWTRFCGSGRVLDTFAGVGGGWEGGEVGALLHEEDINGMEFSLLPPHIASTKPDKRCSTGNHQTGKFGNQVHRVCALRNSLFKFPWLSHVR